VRSGRNLGPVAMVDRFLERFTISDDMIRISLPATDELLYFYALMNTKTGQALIRRDRNGSVIDHLGPKQVAALQYPMVGKGLKQRCIDAFRRGLELREKARLGIDRLADEFMRHTELSVKQMGLKPGDRDRRFGITRSAITDRLDSEPFAPLYRAYGKRIGASRGATQISELADIVHLGRKTTLHVADERFGVKILSGRQVAQYKTIGLKIVSHKAWDDLDDYLIDENTVVLTCDGRAEENLADCALIRSDRAKWAATEHIIRLVPKKGIHPGLLYLACACHPVQQILKSMATGSVVDAIRPPHISPLTIPFPTDPKARELGDEAVEAWDLFAEASKVETTAGDALEAEFMGR
jgi:hypothetical protein